MQLMLPDLDSNQDTQNQNLMYYPYTIGQLFNYLLLSAGNWKVPGACC